MSDKAKTASAKKTKSERRIQAKKRRRRSKIYTAVFYSFYFLTIAALLVFFYYASGVVRDYITAYEAAQPKYKAEEAARPFLEKDYAVLVQCEDPKIFETETYEQYVAYMEDLIGDLEITYTEARSDDVNVRAYDVMAGGNKMGEFKLRHDADDERFNFWLWRIESLDTDVLVSSRYTVEAPDGASVYVDGKKLSEDDIIRWNIVEFETVPLPEGAGVPTRNIYEFYRYFGRSEVTVKDKYGRDCQVTESGSHYSAAFNYDDDRLAGELGDRVEEVVRRLTCYMSNDYALRNLKKDMIEGSNAEQYCEAFDLRWILDHRSYDFHNMRINNYISYGDNCFSCEARYDFEVIYKRSDPEIYPTAYRLFFQKQGDTWKLFDYELL